MLSVAHAACLVNKTKHGAKMVITQSNIIQSLISEALAKSDQEIIQTVTGRHLLGLISNSNSNSNTGLCSILPGLSIYPSQAPEISSSVHNLARNLQFQNTVKASWGLAAINSLLNKDIPGQEVKIQDLLLSLGKDKNVAVIGHFPFVEKMGSQFKNFWVLEKNPGPEDMPENMKNQILPRADVIALTATTLLNDSLGEIINLTHRDCVKMMLGPSTPMASCLLDMGMDYLGGALVQDKNKVIQGIEQGLPFRKLQGIKFIIQGSSKNH